MSGSEGAISSLLDDESIQEDGQFYASSQTITLGLKHSATTDTLDSVLLEPSVDDLDVERALEQNVHTGLEMVCVAESVISEDSKNSLVHVLANEHEREEKPEESGIESHGASDYRDGVKGSQPPNLSSYFSSQSASSDPFGQSFFDAISNHPVDLSLIREKTIPSGLFDSVSDLERQNEENIVVSDQNIKGKVTFTGSLPDFSAQTDEDRLIKELEDATRTEPETEIAKSKVEQYNKNSSRSHHIEHVEPEEVAFDLITDTNNQEPVATPVEIDEKENFESFTAEDADEETRDALGMSSAQSSLGDRNLQEFFRQMSTNSEQSHYNRQISSSSKRSSGSFEISNGAPSSPPCHFSGTPFATPTHQPVTQLTTPNHQPGFHSAEILQHQLGQQQDVHLSQAPVYPITPATVPTGEITPVASPGHKPSISTAGVFPAFPDFGLHDDPFSVSIQMSDTDRRCDAWLPSEGTKAVLISMATSAPGSYCPPLEQLSQPSLAVAEPQGDPVRDLVYRYMGEQEALKRQVATADSVTQDIDGLVTLIKKGCLRSAIDLTQRLLTNAGQGVQPGWPESQHTPQTIQIWFCRLSLLLKLRMYGVAESELQGFSNMDTPDLYYEFYPHMYPGCHGSMVPFGMRILHAELPHHLGRSQEALDRLYYMLAITQKIISHLDDGLAEDGSAIQISEQSRQVSRDLWQTREMQILYTIGNIFLSIKDFESALAIYEMLLDKNMDSKEELLSGIGRIYLQMGHVSKASEYFQKVVEESKKLDKESSNWESMNKGFLSMCSNNFSDAYEHFKMAVQLEPNNTAAVNNMAVCCLYLGKLKDALKSLEALVHRDPDKNLHEGVLFNLCTLYELESSRALHKKQALLDLVSKHKGDGFPVVCLKMA
ncbi:hypothetical protein CHS0354_027678 [Potamilus streckersoni]|uniref:Trafficking protein particle complex subunit 12 n=1 Tax=Potamilus streckersoni TaxID=2493646 RepID=A0AAE0T0L5_9BIVA|nr:hypothetical protein CHS0354_027678 [Potamilus streckersoni]